MADEPEVHGLLALMLLHESRRDALWSTVSWSPSPSRTAPVTTRRRSRRAAPHSSSAGAAPTGGPYVLQAAIASLQAEDEVDWDEVAALYKRLEWVTGSPVVALNRAAAVAEAGAPSGRSSSSTRSSSAITGISIRPGPSCYVALGAANRPGRRSSTRCGWPRLTRSAGSRPPVGGALTKRERWPVGSVHGQSARVRCRPAFNARPGQGPSIWVLASARSGEFSGE